MNIENIPTPETNRAEIKSDSGGGRVNSEKCRDLERRLTVARDALRKVTDDCLWRSDSEFPLSQEKSQELYDLAINALTQTEPKS